MCHMHSIDYKAVKMPKIDEDILTFFSRGDILAKRILTLLPM